MAAEHKPLHVPATAPALPPAWRWHRLDSVTEGIFDCPHSTPDLTEEGPLVARSQDVRTGVLDVRNVAHVSEQTYQGRIARAEPRFGDLLYSREGTYFGIAAEVPPEVQVCLGQRMVLIRPKTGVLNPRFLRYWLNSPVMASHIHGQRDGSVAERLNLPTIRGLPVPVPPIQEQGAIALILGALDDRIELNRRMSETLEAMARALFKSWFVDFDPVRAKSEGRDPELPKPLAGLFPDSFEDSAMGEIPKGWEVETLGDVVEHLRDNENPLDSPDEQFRHFSIPAFDEGQWPTAESGASIKSQKTRVPPGVVLLSKLNPEIARVWLVDVEPGDRAVCSTEFLVLGPRSPHGRTYAYCAMKSQRFRQDLEGLVTGTSKSHQRAQPTAILALAVIKPPAELSTTFERVADPMMARILECRRESRALAIMRDALLPKLISGELGVEHAAKSCGEVA